MSVDFSSYVVPGVYVTDLTQPIITNQGLPSTQVTIIGPGSGYQTYTENVQVYWNVPTRLTQRGIFTTTVSGLLPITAPVITYNGETMVVGVDYAFTVDTSGGGGAPNAITYIERLGNVEPSDPSPNGLVDGDIVSITYQFTNADYYQPQTFTDFGTLSGVYGASMTSTAPTNANASQVNSPISLAAQLAFTNGATTVQCIATDPAVGTLNEQFQAAYSTIATDYTVSLVVPLFVDGALATVSNTLVQADAHTASAVTSLAQDANAACVAAANEGFGRMCFIGPDVNYDSNTTPFNTFAAMLASKRAVLCYPNQFTFFNGAVNQNTTIGGMYLAAALAGVLASNQVNRGLTKLSPSGLSSISAALQQIQTKAFKDVLSASGVTVVELVSSGALQVRHGVTTDPSALNTREISIVRTADAVYALVQSGVTNSGLIGTPITVNAIPSVVSTMTGILEGAVNNSTIVAWGNLQATQQTLPSGDPTIINVSFVYRPAIPMNYIQVSFAIDLTSGDLTGATAASTTT